MNQIEDLKERRERLLLEKEVRRLERGRKLEESAGGWSWWWVIALSLVSLYFILAGLSLLSESPGGLIVVLLALLGLLPLALKIRSR